MKVVLKLIIGKLIAFKAKQYLRRNKTKVIGITGSIGKTSTKEAIASLLSSEFEIYSSKKSFNTEIGLSLSVLQEAESGFSSFKTWFKILKRTFFTEKKSYKYMVLEMGADKPGDIKKLVKIAKPSISVITHVAAVHLAEGQFKDIYDIANEKSELIRNLPKNGIAILNNDDPLISKMETQAKKITYGVIEESDIKAINLVSTNKNISFVINYNSKTQLFEVPVIGKFQVYVLLPAIAVALAMGMDLKKCAEILKDFTLPPGRMNPIDGINGSKIIDGSYNASPTSVKVALEVLSQIESKRKIAAIGSMNELGEMSKDAHFEIGKMAAEIADMIIAVGPQAATYKQGAINANMPEEKIFTFLDSTEAGIFLKDQLEEGDLVVVKGSQNRVRMEKFVKEIMLEPEKASELLCRQGEEWDKI